MEFFIPLIIILLMVLVPLGFWLARDSRGPIRGGPHPDDLPGQRE
jgi:hypothetical protein